jgi:cyclophilin family peptidyl-prolyl cis-trans isomerase
VDVSGDDRWSAEALLRLGALGIGRGDARDLRGAITVHAYDPEPLEILALPGTLKDPADPSTYARLASPDGWGAAERWPLVTPEESRAFDDAELLYRLCLEHDGATMRDQPDRIVIASAVRPRNAARIASLRREIEAGRERNPTLPAWHYFLARLLNEANLHAEARGLIEAIPKSLRRFDAFANLAAEHYIDTERFDVAEEICRAYPYVHNQRDLLTFATKGRKALEDERILAEKTAKMREPSPRALLKTSKGNITLELFEDDAPNAVRNFVDLVARKRFYDGLRFHRVEGGRCLRMGDPRTRAGASGDDDGPAWRLRPDSSPRPMLRGYVTALPVEGGFHGSQLLISFVPMTELEHTLVFARVVEGMDVLLSLEQDDLLEQAEILSRRNHAYDPMAARLDR